MYFALKSEWGCWSFLLVIKIMLGQDIWSEDYVMEVEWQTLAFSLGSGFKISIFDIAPWEPDLRSWRILKFQNLIHQ